MNETLFDLEPADDRAGSEAATHVLMPNMAYACGGNILTKKGRFRVGANGDNWLSITCPDCLAFGQESITRESRRQQGSQADVA